MGSFHLNIPTRGPISDLFVGMPTSIKTFVSEGFAALAKIPASKREELMQVVLGSIDSGSLVEETEAQTKFGLSSDDSRQMLLAAGLIASTLSRRREDTAEAIVDELEKAGALNVADRPAILSFASQVIEDLPTVKKAVERSQLASVVFPSLSQFQTAVDVRLGFEKNRIAFSVPVVLVHIDTDAQGQEIWFQLTRRQVQKIVEDLQESLKQMSVADTWLDKSGK
jgi:hypothetical protein